MPSKRKSPRPHTVNTIDPRYSIDKYPRGSGAIPPTGIRTDSRSEWGRSLETRGGITKTRHAWRIDDALSPKERHVSNTINTDWKKEDNRRDVSFIDHPKADRVILRMLKEDLKREKTKLKYAQNRINAIKRLEDRQKRMGKVSPQTTENLRETRNEIKTLKRNINDIEQDIANRDRNIRNRPSKVSTRKKEVKKNRNQLVGHVSKETAHLVDDYPYGGKLRTKMRIWVETKPKYGQRVVKQTLNPKTGKWNNPKRSTYSPLVVLKKELQSDGRVFIVPDTPYTGADATVKDLDEWGKKYDLNTYQHETLDRLKTGVNARKFIDAKIDDEKQSKKDRDEALDRALNMSYVDLRNQGVVE